MNMQHNGSYHPDTVQWVSFTPYVGETKPCRERGTISTMHCPPWYRRFKLEYNLPKLKTIRRWVRMIEKLVQDGFYEPPPMDDISEACMILASYGWVMNAQSAIDRFYESGRVSAEDSKSREDANGA